MRIVKEKYVDCIECCGDLMLLILLLLFIFFLDESNHGPLCIICLQVVFFFFFFLFQLCSLRNVNCVSRCIWIIAGLSRAGNTTGIRKLDDRAGVESHWAPCCLNIGLESLGKKGGPKSKLGVYGLTVEYS